MKMSSSLWGYMFTSAATRLEHRVEAMRSAEAKLMELAKERFSSSRVCDDLIQMDVLNTRIPRSVVPFKKKTHGLFSRLCCLWTNSQYVENEEELLSDTAELNEHNSLVLHGVRVTATNNHTASESKVSKKMEAAVPLVLLHGYANGCLYFYRNLVGLAQGLKKSFGEGDVYALDLLGWGLSSRPAFDLVDPTCETAEQFFVQSLEAWRKAQRIDKMILAGHSMGGYLSVAYCEAYPHRVERLILLSPVGVPEKKEDPTVSQAYPWRYRVLFHLATRLWKNGTTPPSFIRSLSEYRGRSIVNSYVERRLPALIHQDERDALTDYLYLNAILPGSGEYCLNRILNPLAYAKKPLVYRIPHLLVQDVSFVYGALDWMDPWAALDVQRLCDDNDKSPRVQVYGVQHAGHLLMLDHWEEFNAAVLLSCGATQLESNASQPRLFYNSNRIEARQFFRN